MIKEENGNGARLKLTAGSRPGFNVYGNTNKHDKLKNLEYEKSGHTGFQKELDFDEVPTKDSKNPITSGGVYNAIKNIPGGGGSSDVDLSNYYNKAETNSLLNKKLTAGIADYYVSQLEVDSQGTIEVRDENDTIQLSIKVPSNSVDLDTNTVDLSAVCTKTEVEAYIEETLLGGAW